MTAPGGLGEGEFDAATCHFGLSDIDDLDIAITVVSGALRPAGLFAFSILHPCFPGKGHLRFLASRRPLLRRGTLDGPGDTFRVTPPCGGNHRKLSTYLGTLRRHGLWLDQLTEPLPQADWDSVHDADRKPFFLVARSVKLSST